MDNINKNITNLENSLNLITKTFSNDLLQWLKENLEIDVQKLIPNKEFDIKISIVVDTNTIIRTLEHVIEKGKNSLLFKMISNPIFKFYAPPEIEKEFFKYISNKYRDKKSIYIKKWNELKRIILICKDTFPIFIRNRISEILNISDRKDLPFIYLSISLKSDFILTDNKKHFENFKVIDIENLGKVIATYNRGLFSFTILKTLPDVLKSLFEILKSIIIMTIRVIVDIIVLSHRFLSSILEKVQNEIDESLTKLSHMLNLTKDQLVFGLGLSIIIIGIVSLSNQHLKNISAVSQTIIKQIGKIVESSMTNVNILVKKIVDILKTLKSISPELFTYLLAIVSNIVTDIAFIIQDIKIKEKVIYNSIT